MSTPTAKLDGDAIAERNRRTLATQIEELLRIRREAEETAAFLIEILDEKAPDPDLEENGDDEPPLGWTGAEAAYSRYHGTFDGENEPSLGWTVTFNQAARQRLGEGNDREQEHDGREDDEREFDPADYGLCDRDALDEFEQRKARP